MMPERDRDVVRERDGDRDRDPNGVSPASGGEKEEILRGSWDRDRDGGRNRDRDRGRGRESSRDRGRGRESSRDRGRGRESSKDIDRDRRVVSRASGGEREEIKQFSGERFRRYNDNDAADFRKKEVYDDDERRPVGRDRGREYDDDERRPIGRDRGGEYDDDERRPMGRGRGRGRGWGGRGRGDHDKPVVPPLYSILKATVHSIRPFGIFVQMEGYRNHGLVHLSQVSDHEVTKRDDSEDAKVKALSSVANEGEQVWIKVISVKVEEDGSTKIGCSMKYVSQGDGQDLDPNNIQAEKQQSRPSWKEPQKFKLEAVYNVQCERCGGHGHLKKECYSSGEKTYKLLSDDEDAELAVQNLTKSEERLPKESSKHMQPPKPASGISNHLLATGSVGRGRAVVQPAWMKHGIGVGGPAPPMADTEQKPVSALPEKMETVEDALAVIAMLKEEKHRRKEERHRKKDKRHRSRDEKKDKHKKRHRNEEDHKDRHGSRKKHRDVEESDEDDYKERKKHRDEKDSKERKKHSDVEESDEDGYKDRKKHRDEKDSKERKKRRDVEESDEDGYKERKKHRDVEEYDEDDYEDRKKHRDEKDSKERHKKHRDVGESDEDDFKERKKHRDVDDFKERSKKHRDEDHKERHSSHSRHRD